jgi:hypothetical protein
MDVRGYVREVEYIEETVRFCCFLFSSTAPLCIYDICLHPISCAGDIQFLNPASCPHDLCFCSQCLSVPALPSPRYRGVKGETRLAGGSGRATGGLGMGERLLDGKPVLQFTRFKLVHVNWFDPPCSSRTWQSLQSVLVSVRTGLYGWAIWCPCL